MSNKDVIKLQNDLEDLVDQLKGMNITTSKEDEQLESIIFKLGKVQIKKTREEELRDLMYKINHPGSKKSKR
jgi:hypothetical protein